MHNNDKYQIADVPNQDYIVTKSNTLVYQKLKLGINEQKMIVALAAKIQPNDEEFNLCVFKVADLAKSFGIDPHRMYADIRKITANLMSSIVEAEIKDKNSNEKPRIKQFGLISTAEYIPSEGIVKLKFCNDVIPFYLGLKEFFTTYRLNNILRSKSKYSIPIYEIIKSHQFKKKEYSVKLYIDELKGLLKLSKAYSSFGNINLKVLKPAIKDINKLTDISVSIGETIKEGRKIIGINLNVTTNNKTHVSKDAPTDSLDKEALIKTYGQAAVESAILAVKNKGDDIHNYWKYVEGIILNKKKINNKSKTTANFKERDYDYNALEEGLLYGEGDYCS